MNALSIMLDILGIIAIAGIGWLLFRGIHSDGKRADDARNQLDSATAGQRETAGALDRVADGADESADTAKSVASGVSDALDSIDAAQRDIDESARILADSARRYDESARILREIRAGARTGGGAAADAKDGVATRER